MIAPAATGTAATDTANLLASIAATPVGGWMHVRSGVYKLTAPLVISKHMKLTGAGAIEALLGAAADVPDTPSTAPFLYGTVFEMQTAATNVIELTGLAAQHIDLADFGIMFASAIRFTNTGHGIYSQPPAYSSGSDTGIMRSSWTNITVFGHDGNHYGYRVMNPIWWNTKNLRAHGGGGFYVECDSYYTNYGNMHHVQPYSNLMTAGSAHGFHIKARTKTGNGGIMGLAIWERPQCNGSGHLLGLFPNTTKPTSSQYLWKDEGDPRDNLVIAPDLENLNSGVTHPVAFGDGTYVQPEGGYNNLPMWYRREKLYNEAYQPTITVGAGLGSGGSPAAFKLSGCTDTDGTLACTCGTTPGSAGTDVFTVTFATPMTVAPRFVILTPWAVPLSTAPDFYVQTVSTTGFNVRSRTALTGGVTYQLAYFVVQ